MRDVRAADLLMPWAHRGWSERSAACRYARLAAATRHSALARFAPALELARDDELRHAELCDRACIALGGVPIADPSDDAPLVDDLVLEVAMTCVGETLNVVTLQHELRTQTALRSTIHALLRDELVHARLGWAMLDTARTLGPLDRLRLTLAAALAEAVPRDRALFDVAIATLIIPGLRHCGIDLYGPISNAAVLEQ